jgi:hypothetical protein
LFNFFPHRGDDGLQSLRRRGVAPPPPPPCILLLPMGGGVYSKQKAINEVDAGGATAQREEVRVIQI